MDYEYAPEIFDRMLELHELAALSHPQLVLWPEASVPGGIYGSVEIQEWINAAASQVPALILGTDDLKRGGVEDADHNSAALFIAGKKEVQIYDKMHLVPFGEYLPMRPLLGWAIGGLVPGDFKPGEKNAVMDIPQPALKLAPLICFEDTNGSLTREPVKMGAQLLVNITNDGWFGQSVGAKTHLNNAIFRAVENRRPLFRCTNTGYTALVDDFGRIENLLPPFEKGIATCEIKVPAVQPLTFYTRHGEWLAVLSSSLTLLALFLRRDKQNALRK
jgi:apolipoprotein N-acyltransferase